MTKEQIINWNDAVTSGGRLIAKLDGGDPDNNVDNLNSLLANNLNYTIDAYNSKDQTGGELTVNFKANKSFARNFKLGNAYQLTLTLIASDGKSQLGTIVLPFELTQPTLDITRASKGKAVWNAAGSSLKVYGDFANNNMYLPLYEAFATAYSTPYSAFKDGAQYYKLSSDGAKTSTGTFLGQSYASLSNLPLTEIDYSATSAGWNTSIPVAAVANGYNVPNVDNVATIEAEYKIYDVYSANVPNFTLKFATLLGEGTLAAKAGSKPVSNDDKRSIILSDADFTLTGGLGKTFHLFDGIAADGKNTEARSIFNGRNGFEEGVLGFATNFVFGVQNVTASYMHNGTKTSIAIETGTAELTYNANTKTRAYVATQNASANTIAVSAIPAVEAIAGVGVDNYPAIPGGVMIQLPATIGTTEPVTIVFTLTDVFGVRKALSFTLYAPGV